MRKSYVGDGNRAPNGPKNLTAPSLPTTNDRHPPRPQLNTDTNLYV